MTDGIIFEKPISKTRYLNANQTKLLNKRKGKWQTTQSNFSGVCNGLVAPTDGLALYLVGPLLQYLRLRLENVDVFLDDR